MYYCTSIYNIKHIRNGQKNQFSIDYKRPKFYTFLCKIASYLKSICYCKKENTVIARHEKMIKPLLRQLHKYINTNACKFRKQIEQQNPS